jgi:hypothetical protein
MQSHVAGFHFASSFAPLESETASLLNSIRVRQWQSGPNLVLDGVADRHGG